MGLALNKPDGGVQQPFTSPIRIPSGVEIKSIPIYLQAPPFSYGERKATTFLWFSFIRNVIFRIFLSLDMAHQI
jgi:hypothetical protein